MEQKVGGMYFYRLCLQKNGILGESQNKLFLGGGGRGGEAMVNAPLLPSLVAQRLKRLPAMWETWVQSLGWEDSLEKEMATHSSILAWRIPWTEEPGGLQSMGLQRVGHD